METSTTTVLIMAGGQGRRMRATGVQLPKPLVPVRGVPLLERALVSALKADFRDIVVATPADVPEIARFIRTRGQALATSVGASLQVLEELRPLGTAGAARALHVRTSEILLLNADNLTALDLRALLECHRRSGAALTVATHREPYRLPYGEIDVQEGQVSAYREKPELLVRISSGTNVLGEPALALLPVGERADIPWLVGRLLTSGQPVAAYHHSAPWIDVNDAATVERAEALVARHLERFECWTRPPDLEVVGALLLAGDALLLERRPVNATCYPGLWDTPGGKLEPGEAPAHAMARELLEELGLTAQASQAVASFDDLDPASRLLVRHHVFTAHIDPAAAMARQGQHLAWVPRDAVARLEGLSPIVARSLGAQGGQP